MVGSRVGDEERNHTALRLCNIGSAHLRRSLHGSFRFFLLPGPLGSATVTRNHSSELRCKDTSPLNFFFFLRVLNHFGTWTSIF